MHNLRYHSPPRSTLGSAVNRPSGFRLSAAGAAPLALLLSFAACFAWGCQPAVTFQPTIVGILWGGLFLAGYLVGGTGRGQFATLLLASPLGYLSWQAFFSLTDVAAADSLLLVAVLLAGGWVAAQHAVLSGASDRSWQCGTSRPGRFSIWDIGFGTTVVACVAHAVPRLQTPPLLQFAVAAALASGLICSWMACVWAWKDNWNWRSLAALLATMTVGAGSLYLAAPAGLSLLRLLQWGLIGPVNVIATQATVVLAILTIWRWERSRLHAVSKVESETR